MRLPFFNRGPRRRENTRFRNRARDSRLAVEVPMSKKEMRLRRQARSRALVRWSCIGTGALVALLYCRSFWREAFHRNPEFSVARFEYRSNGGIPARQAATAAGIRSDTNLMEVDLGEIRSRLLALPRVKNVSVERRLPDRLAISLEERLPFAWITSEANSIDHRQRLFVDRDGVVFKCEELLQEYMTLPVIDAADQPMITLGREITSASMKAALELLSELQTRDWSVPCAVARIEIRNAWTLTAEMESKAIYTFRPDHLGSQLDRLEFILAKTRAARKNVATVNLQMQRNVPVTFYTPAAPVAEAAPVPGTAVPLAPSGPVSWSPADKSSRKAPAAAGSSPKPAPAARQDRDIQTILRGT